MENKKGSKIFSLILFLLFCGLVLYCVDSVSYSIQINGYNQCKGRVEQGYLIAKGLSNIGKSELIVNNESVLSGTLNVLGSSGITCEKPSRIFE